MHETYIFNENCMKRKVHRKESLQWNHVAIPPSLSDDILESFLAEYRQKKGLHTPTTSPSHHLMEAGMDGAVMEGEEEVEEGGFPIPELPSGRVLVINILTTWGDRYYVGLSGIEVFTASGEKAEVEEVNYRVAVTLFLCT